MRYLLPRLALSLATLAVVLAVGELAVRVFTRVDRRLTVRDPVIGKRYVRGFDDEVYIPESGRTVRLRFNRDGFRGPDWPYEKPERTRRVAVVGDSMTVAVNTAEERTMVVALQRLLERAFPETAWEALNFGVSSASTGQELVLYRELVWRYQPDVVVLAFFVGNDLADNSRRLTSAPRIYFELDELGGLRQLPYRAVGSGLSKWLNQHSRLYVWYRSARARSREGARELARRLPSRFQVFNTAGGDEVRHAWELTRRLLAVFRDEVAAHGSRFVVAVIPTGPQVYDDLWAEVVALAGEDERAFDRDYPERMLAAICGDLGVECVTMAEEFRAAAEDGQDGGERLFYDRGRAHFTDAGNLLAAEILYRRLTAGVEHGEPDDGPAR